MIQYGVAVLDKGTTILCGQRLVLNHLVVLRLGCIDGFSWPVSVHGKVPHAVNGQRPSQER